MDIMILVKKIGSTTEGITGVSIITRIVNISSVPSTMVSKFLQSKINLVYKPSLMRLNSSLGMDMESRLFLKPQKIQSVWFVVDEDDEFHNVKIRNICELCSYFMIGKLVMIKENCKTNSAKPSGVIARVTNPHLKNEDSKLLGCVTNFKNFSKCSSSIIVKTTSKLHGSIAGLTVLMNALKVRFTIEHQIFVDGGSWLLMKTTNLNEMKFENENLIDDTIPDDDNAWAQKMGYCDHLMTSYGIKKIKKYEKEPKPNIVQIKKIMTYIFIKINEIKNKLINLVRYHGNQKKGNSDKNIKTTEEMNKNKNKNKKMNKQKPMKNMITRIASQIAYKCKSIFVNFKKLFNKTTINNNIKNDEREQKKKLMSKNKNKDNKMMQNVWVEVTQSKPHKVYDKKETNKEKKKENSRRGKTDINKKYTEEENKIEIVNKSMQINKSKQTSNQVRKMKLNKSKPPMKSLAAIFFTRTLANATVTATSIALNLVKTDANKEIKQANKMLAKNFIAKTLSKPNMDKDKTIPLQKTSAAADAYLVGVTSYSTNDAIAQAQATAGYQAAKRKTQIIIVQCIINMILLIINGNSIRAALVLSTMLITTHYKHQVMGLHIMSILSYTSFPMKVISAGMIYAEYLNVLNSLTSTLSSVVMGIATLI